MLAALVLGFALLSPPTGQVRLWDGDAPGALGAGPEDIPTLTVFRAPGEGTHPAFVVCPGGGYAALAEHEAGPPAEWLNSLGIDAFVLKYRLGPKYHYPEITGDVLRAIRLVRFHAREWKIDPKRVGVLGFSAGGHLAGCAATMFDDRVEPAKDAIDKLSARPDAAALIYPVVLMTPPYMHQGSRDNLLGPNPAAGLAERLSLETRVTKRTPPCFLVAASDDKVVPIENSLAFVDACRKAKVPVEFHPLTHGGHGFGMGGDDPELNRWPGLCADWLRSIKFLEPAR